MSLPFDLPFECKGLETFAGKGNISLGSGTMNGKG